MLEWIAANWDKVLLSLVTTGALSFCAFLGTKLKHLRGLIEQEEQAQLDEAIEEKTAPIIKEIEELRDYVRKVDKSEQHKINLIISSYKYRLNQLCRLYLKQHYMTIDEYDQLNEFFHLYEALGGNGEAKVAFEQTIQLPKYATHEEAAEALRRK